MKPSSIDVMLVLVTCGLLAGAAMAVAYWPPNRADEISARERQIEDMEARVRVADVLEHLCRPECQDLSANDLSLLLNGKGNDMAIWRRMDESTEPVED